MKTTDEVVRLRARAGEWKPSVAEPDPTMLDFIARLHRAPAVGNLQTFLAAIQRDSGAAWQLADLTGAVARACYGAFWFDVLAGRDDGARRRRMVQRFRSTAPAARKALSTVINQLELSAEHSEFISHRVERCLRARYGDAMIFPDQKALFLLDFLGLLADEIDPRDEQGSGDVSAARELNFSLNTNMHGCIDFQRPLRGAKVRETGQLLAFNLELIFRSASLGVIATTGAMPKDGTPSRHFIAKLVTVTLGISPSKAHDATWVEWSVNSILKEGDCPLVVPWPDPGDSMSN